MKVGIQKLVREVRPPASTIGSLGTPPSADVRSICKLHIEQLAVQVPIVAAWIVYEDSDTGMRQFVAHYTQQQGSIYAGFPHPLSVVWWEDWLPDAIARVFTPRRDTVPCPYNAYVCALSQHSSRPEYLMLWSEYSLSVHQQECIEQQAQLLSHYLTMFRECSRQKAEIQLLEQVLRRAEHQLRNPLALISLYSENLCRGLQSGGLQEQATIIRETVDDLSANLTDLVYCGQQAKLRVAPYDLREILADSIQGLRPWLEEKQVDICYPDKPVIVAVDRWQMKQVFDNLLSNAIHFSPEGGVVTCNWQVFAMEVIVEVSDRGSGLSQEDLKQVFTPFYSKRPGGTGLGLAIAKKIIFDHKGSIWVENLSVGGAQFSFILPRNN